MQGKQFDEIYDKLVKNRNKQAKILGSIFATIGVVLPSFIIILLVASLLKKLIK